MCSTELDKVFNRIWITERCHMQAEKRNRFLEIYFHITLALYSLATISISIFPLPNDAAGLFNMAAFTSILTLSLSLLVFGFKFGETAAQHRSCYLDLQMLRSANPADRNSSLQEAYIDILRYYPNHSSWDYKKLSVSNIFSKTQNLKDSNEHKIEYTVFFRALYALQCVVVWSACVAFALFPAYLLISGSHLFAGVWK